MDGVQNVVLVTIDCLRPDHLSAYGYDRETAPFLSDLAEESLVFENAYATEPGTFISFPSIFTGTFPFDFGGYAKLTSDRTPVAEILFDHDISTAGVHSNTYLSRAFGYQRGFDKYETFYDRSGGLVRLEKTVRRVLNEDGLPFRLLKRLYEAIVEGDSGDMSLPYEQADSTTDTVVDILRSSLSPPFFLWTHYMDPHAPHRPPPRHVEEFDETIHDWEAHHERWLSAKHDPATATVDDERQFVDAYDAEIRFVDEQLSRLFEEMRQLGVHGETAYLVTADHGELLGEHGQFSHPPRLFEELIRVPLFLHVPGVTDGTRVESLVSLLDIPSTVADFFGVPQPDSYRGTSLCTFCDGDNPVHDYVFAEVCHRTGEGMEKGVYERNDAIVACRSPTAKLIRDEQRSREEFTVPSHGGNDGPGSVPHREQTALRQTIEDHLRAVETNEDVGAVEIDEQTAERLRELGYAE